MLLALALTLLAQGVKFVSVTSPFFLEFMAEPLNLAFEIGKFRRCVALLDVEIRLAFT